MLLVNQFLLIWPLLGGACIKAALLMISTLSPKTGASKTQKRLREDNTIIPGVVVEDRRQDFSS